MSVMKSYGAGLRSAGSRPGLSLLLWFFNLVFAGIVAFVFTGIFSRAFNGSLVLDSLRQCVDLNILLEFITGQIGSLGQLSRTLILLLLIFAVAQAFFAGGILNVLLRGRGGRTGEIFFAGGGRYFGRFLRLIIYSIPLWIGCFFIYLPISFVLGLWAADPDQEMLGFILILVRIGCVLVLINAVRMVLDYARIGIVQEDSPAVARALIAALRFVAVRPGQTFGLYYLWMLTGGLIFAGYIVLQSAFPKTAPAAVSLGFLITQAHILIRSGLRIGLLAGQADLFRRRAGRSTKSVQGPGRQGDDRLEQAEDGVDRDPDELEGEEKQPDQGEQDQGQQGQGPAEHQQDEPQ